MQCDRKFDAHLEIRRRNFVRMLQICRFLLSDTHASRRFLGLAAILNLSRVLKKKFELFLFFPSEIKDKNFYFCGPEVQYSEQKEN